MPSRPATPPPPAPEGRIAPSAPSNAVDGLVNPPSSSENMEEWARKILDWKEKNELQVQKLQAEKTELEETNRELSEQIAKAISDFNQAREDYTGAFQANDALRGQLGQVEEELRAMEARNESLLAEKAGLSASLDEVREEVKRLTDRLRLEESTSASFRGELKSLREAYDQCQADLAEAQKERSVFRRQVEGLESGEAERVNQIDDLRGKLASANEALGKKDAELLALESRVEEVFRRLDATEGVVNQLEIYAKEVKDAELSAAVTDGRAKLEAVKKQADELSARLKGGDEMDSKKTTIREKTPVAEEEKKGESGLDQPVDLSGMRSTVAGQATATYSWQLLVIAMMIAFAIGAGVALVVFYQPATATVTEADEEGLAPMAEEDPVPVTPKTVASASSTVSEPDTAQVADTLRVKNNAPVPEVPTEYEKVADCAKIADPKKLTECIDFVNPGRVSDCEVGEGQEALRGACLKKVAEKLLGQ